MIGAVMIIWTDIRVWSRLGINFEAGNPLSNNRNYLFSGGAKRGAVI